MWIYSYENSNITDIGILIDIPTIHLSIYHKEKKKWISPLSTILNFILLLKDLMEIFPDIFKILEVYIKIFILVHLQLFFLFFST